jgi:competence protein ComEC
VPDAERALARRGTTLVGTVKSGALVEVVGSGSTIDEMAARIRAFSRRAIAASVGSRSPRSAAIVAAIVIGDRAGLDDEVQRRLQDAGTYHVIAISGGNIAVIAGLLLAAFRIAGVLGRVAMLTAIAVLLSYARLVGGGASVDRATWMAVLYFGARVIDQHSAPLNTLALVAAGLFVAQPLSAFDPAFVLTFGATAAILLAAPLVRARRLPRWLNTPASLLAASMATEAMLMPVGAMAFARVTFAGLALNFAAIPLMTVVQTAGMALVPVSLVSSRAAAALGLIAHLGATGLIWTAELVRYAPAVAMRVAPPSWWVVVLYYASAAAVLLVWRRRPQWTPLPLALAGGAAIWIVAQPWTLLASRGDGRLHVTFLDVGQGDAAFVRFPHGATLLVDAGGAAGGTFDIGDRVVAPVLRDAGVRRLDCLVLTHGDPDHIGGAASVIREFKPRQIWEGVPVPRFEPLRLLHSEGQAAGAAWTTVKSGDRARFDTVEVAVLHPELPDWERQRVRNDDSIVLELRWRDVSVVLTGDVGRASERILPPLPPVRLRIVKVPHHGSLTSSSPEFVRALAPRLAVVSAGRANRFGHPVPEVVQRYRDAGAEIFRTDKDGAVRVDTDGISIDVRTFSEPQRAWKKP